jgi:hypothetical protein
VPTTVHCDHLSGAPRADRISAVTRREPGGLRFPAFSRSKYGAGFWGRVRHHQVVLEQYAFGELIIGTGPHAPMPAGSACAVGVGGADAVRRRRTPMGVLTRVTWRFSAKWRLDRARM